MDAACLALEIVVIVLAFGFFAVLAIGGRR
jgi:hypothetical protein